MSKNEIQVRGTCKRVVKDELGNSRVVGPKHRLYPEPQMTDQQWRSHLANKRIRKHRAPVKRAPGMPKDAPERAYELVLKGFITDVDLGAVGFAVHKDTFRAWRKKHPQLQSAIDRAKGSRLADRVQTLQGISTDPTHKQVVQAAKHLNALERPDLATDSRATVAVQNNLTIQFPKAVPAERLADAVSNIIEGELDDE